MGTSTMIRRVCGTLVARAPFGVVVSTVAQLIVCIGLQDLPTRGIRAIIACVNRAFVQPWMGSATLATGTHWWHPMWQFATHSGWTTTCTFAVGMFTWTTMFPVIVAFGIFMRCQISQDK